MADVEFFFDPVCPFAWVTSQWVRAVDAQRELNVEWRPISLSFLNEGSDLYERAPQMQVSHQRGLRLLRVCMAAKAVQDARAVGRLYRAFGTTIHNEQHADRLDLADGIRHILTALTLPANLSDAVDDESFDKEIRESTDEAIDRVGQGVGTPIITFRGGASFFGPVISHAPSGDKAVQMWDAVELLANNSSFSELKRTKRPSLDFTGGQR
jgi:2-hydroxychromene-2-carboxylate isomerase